MFGAFCFIVSNSFRAFALTEALESTKASIVRLLSKSRGRIAFPVFLWLSTTVEVNGRYKSLFCSSLTNLFPMCGVVDEGRELLLSPSRVVIMCFVDSWMSVGNLLELSRNSTCSFPDFFRNCSVAVPELWRWNRFGSDVGLATWVVGLLSNYWVF